MTAYDLSRYLNVRSAYGSSFAPDGTLAFLMNTTGVAQLWSLPEPHGWPEQLTFYDDTVSFVDFSPERQELVFGMDNGGNERAQLFRLDPDRRIDELTGTPDAKHRWGGWSPDGERFAFASNRRDEAVFDIYVQARDATGDDAELVWEGDGWFSVGGFSPDGERLLVSEAHSSSTRTSTCSTRQREPQPSHATRGEGPLHEPVVGTGGRGVYSSPTPKRHARTCPPIA